MTFKCVASRTYQRTVTSAYILESFHGFASTIITFSKGPLLLILDESAGQRMERTPHLTLKSLPFLNEGELHSLQENTC